MASIENLFGKDAVKGVEDMVNIILKANEATEKLLQSAVELNKQLAKQTGAKKSAENQKVLTDAEKQAIRQNKQLEAAEKKRADGLTRVGKEIIKVRTETTKDTQAEKLAQKQTDALKGSYDRLSATLSINLKKWRALSAEQRKNAAVGVKLQASINKTQTQLKKLDSQTGISTRNVGKYGLAMKGFGRQLAGAAGLTSGVFLLVGAIRRGVKALKDFGQALASLSAITGATGKELRFYRDEAKKASKQTQQSGAEMLKAFERVGSIRPELLKAKEALVEVTNAAVILSESTGGMLDLEQAADATAGVMNQLGIDSSEALRVINALAAGSKFGSSTTLDLSEAFKKFGKVAKDSNLSLEQSVALVELSASKMIVGSDAGTALRGTLLRLKAAGLGYQSGVFDINDAIDEMNAQLGGMGSELDKDALKLKIFGQRNIVLGSIILDNQDKFNELTKEVTGTTTALDQQSKQNDTLAGSITRMGKAWDTFLAGGTRASNFLKTIANGVSLLLGADSKYDVKAKTKDLKNYNDVWRNLAERAKETGTDFEVLARNEKVRASTLRELGLTTEEYSKALGEVVGWLDERVLKAEESRLATLAAAEADRIATEEALKLAAAERAKKLAERAAEGGDIKKLGHVGPVIPPEIAIANWVKDEVIRLETEKQEGVRMEMRKTEEAQFEAFEREVELAEHKKQMAFEIAQEAGNLAFDAYQTSLNRQLSALETQRNFELALHEGNAEKQDEITQRFAKKEAAIRRKQAVADKLAAIFNIAINTAVAAMAQASIPLAGFGLAAAMIALGAIQIGIVAAQPIPQFKHGTSDSPEGWAMVSEAGPELIIGPGGDVSLSGKRKERRWLERGSQVIPNKETSELLSGAGGYDSLEVMGLAGVMNDGFNRLNNTIKNKRELTIVPSKSKIIERKGRYFKEYLNAKTS